MLIGMCLGYEGILKQDMTKRIVSTLASTSEATSKLPPTDSGAIKHNGHSSSNVSELAETSAMCFVSSKHLRSLTSRTPSMFSIAEVWR